MDTACHVSHPRIIQDSLDLAGGGQRFRRSGIFFWIGDLPASRTIQRQRCSQRDRIGPALLKNSWKLEVGSQQRPEEGSWYFEGIQQVLRASCYHYFRSISLSPIASGTIATSLDPAIHIAADRFYPDLIIPTVSRVRDPIDAPVCVAQIAL